MDRRALKGELAALWGCGKANQVDLINKACERAQASLFRLPGNEDVLAVKMPSTGNCGDFQFAVLGPVTSTGNRRSLGGEALYPACGEEMKFEPTRKALDRPTITFVALDRVTSSGLEYHDDERWEWTGSNLVLAKSLKRN